MAGAPRDLVQGRNYSRLFATLESNKIKAFYPTFQYQEVPAPRSLGYETDFSASCSRNSAAFAALRASSVKLLLPAELLYPDPSRIASQPGSSDALRKMLECAGRSSILGVANYDEAAFNGVPISQVRALYDHVKSVDPTLPVYMIHAPIVADKPEFGARNGRRSYLRKVADYSRYGDVVGFDVYPIPQMVAQILPLTGDGESGIGAPYDQTVGSYSAWLAATFPAKRKLMVFQGFAYSNMYEPDFLRQNIPAALIAAVRPPSRSELKTTHDEAIANGVDTIIFWGQAALRDESEAPWPDILWLARTHGRLPTGQRAQPY